MRNLQNRHLATVLSAGLIASLAWGCGQKDASNAHQVPDAAIGTKPVRGGELTVRLSSPPTTFNYLLAADEATIITSQYLLTSRLVEFDHRTQQFVPGLAEALNTAADGRTVEIVLREGLRFSDGNDLTVDDVIFTLNAIYDKRSEAAGLRDAMLIEDKPIESRRIDDRRMILIFPRSVASVESYLVNLGVLPSHVLRADMDAGKLATAWKITSPPESVVSSGPFILTNVKPGERIELGRNPHYWKQDSNNERLPYLDRLILQVAVDPNNTLIQLKQGAIDLADRIRGSDLSALSQEEGPVRAVSSGPGLGVDHLWFNLNVNDPKGRPLDNSEKRAWFADSRFRRAVAMAVDRDSIASLTLQGLATPLHGFVSPANRVWLNERLPRIAYDLETAEKLLEEAGFRRTGTEENPALLDTAGRPVEFTVVVPAENEPRLLMASVIQHDLGKLGIKMRIAPLEFAALTKKWTETYEYDAALLGIAQGDIEPSSYQSFLLSSGDTHQWRPNQKSPVTGWEAKIDRLFAEQATERDASRRRALFDEIQLIMQDEMPVIPIVARHVTAAATKRVGNFAPSSILPYSLWNADELFVNASPAR